MTLDLSPIKARIEAATEGPWEVKTNRAGNPTVGVVGSAGYLAPWIVSPGDAAFIAAARTDIPCLVRQLEAAWAAPKPFADEAENYDEEDDKDSRKVDDLGVADITVGHLRVARAVLTGATSKGCLQVGEPPPSVVKESLTTDARTDIPALVAEVERLKRYEDFIRNWFAPWGAWKTAWWESVSDRPWSDENALLALKELLPKEPPR